MTDKQMRIFTKGDRVVTETGTHGIVSKVLKGKNGGWYDLQLKHWPYTVAAFHSSLQRYGDAEWHGEWAGPDRLEG